MITRGVFTFVVTVVVELGGCDVVVVVDGRFVVVLAVETTGVITVEVVGDLLVVSVVDDEVVLRAPLVLLNVVSAIDIVAVVAVVIRPATNAPFGKFKND